MGQLHKNKIYTSVLFFIVGVSFFSTCCATPSLFLDQKDTRLSYTLRLPIAVNPPHSLEVPIGTPLHEIPSRISAARQNLDLPPSIPFDQRNAFLEGWQIMTNSRIESYVPGYIIVKVSEGERVGVDSPLCVIDCMKMECVVNAARTRSAGIITHVFVKTGIICEQSTPLFGFQPDSPIWEDAPPPEGHKELLLSFFPVQEEQALTQDTLLPSEEDKASSSLPLTTHKIEEIIPVSPEVSQEEVQEVLGITKEKEPPHPPMREKQDILPPIPLGLSQGEGMSPKEEPVAVAPDEEVNPFTGVGGQTSGIREIPCAPTSYLCSLIGTDSQLRPHASLPFLGNPPLTHMTLPLGAQNEEHFYHAPLSSPLKKGHNDWEGVEEMGERLICQLLALLILAFILRARFPSPIPYRDAQAFNKFVSVSMACNINASLKVWHPRRKAF